MSSDDEVQVVVPWETLLKQHPVYNSAFSILRALWGWSLSGMVPLHLAAAAGNNRLPSVVDQEDVADMRRPRNRDNVEVIDAMQRSILQATNALTRAMEGRAQPLPSITPPPAGQELGEQIDSLYKRLKAARETGMDASAVRYERQIADLEARDEELTRSRFLGNN